TFHEGLVIKSYRSSLVSEMLGEDTSPSKAVQDDINIQKALSGEEVLVVGDESVRFLYPMRVQDSCITCHYNSNPGDINGVLDIYLPIEDINIPLHTMINYFMLFLILFLIAVFIIFYFVLENKIINPLVRFTSKVQNIAEHKDLNRRIAMKSPVSEISHIATVFNDLLDEIKYCYDKMTEQFYLDSLTSLPNSLALKHDLEPMQTPTLILFNIDSFQGINDFYGHEVGDHILIELAKRIKVSCKKTGKTYRLGSDEFVWISEEVLDVFNLLEILETLNNTPYIYKKSEILITITCGVSEDKEHTIEKAVAALRSAKENNKPMEVYSNHLENKEDFEQNILWTARLKEALDEKRLVVYYQPILAVGLEHAQKFESLVRLVDKDGVVHSPYYFMDVAKHSKLYFRITRTVIEQSFKYFRNKTYEFSVNISIDDILDDLTRNYMIEQLKSFPEPQRVIFEILETEEISEFDVMNDFVQEIRDIGARVAIDDFGSGYSNYSYIIKLHADFLKIDSSLIQNIDTDKDSEIVVESIMMSAKKLGIKTIAEFIHSEAVMKKVKAMGVDFIQGYYVGKPEKEVF
ncbi:MAG: EAL domain-containing protein, partial [Campylobacterota bacterium]|nr:EAL domain-containing protein [Campylobacterota bacterium]